MSARFSNTSRKRRSRPSVASSVPGSVMARKRRPSPPVRSQKWASWLLVSMVDPDLEAATNRHLARSSSASTRAMAAGSVVSSTRRSRWPGAAPKVCHSTSGKRLEPPIPMMTTWSRPSAAAAPASSSSSPRRPCTSATTGSHPSRSATSVGSSCQRVWSALRMRATASASTSSATAASTASAARPRRSLAINPSAPVTPATLTPTPDEHAGERCGAEACTPAVAPRRHAAPRLAAPITSIVGSGWAPSPPGMLRRPPTPNDHQVSTEPISERGSPRSSSRFPP